MEAVRYLRGNEWLKTFSLINSNNLVESKNLLLLKNDLILILGEMIKSRTSNWTKPHNSYIVTASVPEIGLSSLSSHFSRSRLAAIPLNFVIAGNPDLRDFIKRVHILQTVRKEREINRWTKISD